MKYADRLRDYLSLKGIEIKNNKCRCFHPLHEDKNPSCLVGKHVFHCFSCDTRGDIYDAVSLIENIPFDGEVQFDFLEKFFSRYYKCAHCGGIFEKGRTDEEAMAEQKEDLPGVPLSECDLVCDDCYKQFYKEIQKADNHGV
jgi:Fe2+ or Zn2+ uptake regulation protein